MLWAFILMMIPAPSTTIAKICPITFGPPVVCQTPLWQEPCTYRNLPGNGYPKI
jgi:hypothetical protein